MVTATKTVTLEIREAGCGHYVALPDFRWKELEDTGVDFTCPYGDRRAYVDSENTKLRKRLAEAQELANTSRQKEVAALGMLDAERKVTKRLLRRVHAGVCPHCHRTFQQLARHMASKHKEPADAAP